MPKYIGAVTILLFIAMVIIRIFSLKQQGINAIEFGKKDRKDFLLLPFAFFYFYLIAAHVFDLSTFGIGMLFQNEILSWAGVIFCLLALGFFIWTMISFKKSFRVGLAENSSQGLITDGAFAISRNPIYVSFGLMLVGQFLIFPNWVFIIYVFAGVFTFHNQVLKEEKLLKTQYGEEFEKYCREVNRYF